MGRYIDYQPQRKAAYRPTSEEHRQKLAERAREQHARRRGFAIPPEKLLLYTALQRAGHSVADIKRRLGLE